jgi:hypothetical protein
MKRPGASTVVCRLLATNAELWEIFNKAKRWRIEGPS